MATESERYLRKARESLASAEADVAAGRCNSAANRAYYAAFQAAIAALIHHGASPSAEWKHDFVGAEFSSKLIRRRKVFGQPYARVLRDLFDLRLVADYREYGVSKRESRIAVRQAGEVFGLIEKWIGVIGVGEPRTEYGSEMKTTTKQPQEYVEELKAMISSAYPDLRLVVQERSPTDYTIEIYGDESVWEAHQLISERRTEIVDDHGVWIVVLPLDESWTNQ